MANLELEDYSLKSEVGRFFVRCLFWIAMGLVVLAGFIDGIQEKQYDSETMFNMSMNALSSIEGFLKFQAFNEILSIPVIGIIGLTSFVFILYSLIISIKLLIQCKEVIGALLLLICSVSNSFYYFINNLHDYASISLFVIIIFIITGIYFLIRDAQGSLSTFSFSLIIYGAELIWPRYYKIHHHTFQDSGILMTIIGIGTLFFVLESAKDLLCDSKKTETSAE